MYRVRSARTTVLLTLILAACSDVDSPDLVSSRFRAAAMNRAGVLAVEYEFRDTVGIKLIDPADPDGARLLVASGAGEPDWSPDDASIVLSAGFEIFELDVATGAVRSLSTTGFSVGPAYSPDGAVIAYSSNGDNGSQPPDLWLMSRAGTGHRRVPLPAPRGEMRDPDWSPDGARIVSSMATTGGVRLFVTDTLGQDTAYITPTGVAALHPAWSPDGQHIAYARAAGNFAELWLINPDGTNDHRIADNGAFPSWEPNGSGLVFLRFQGSVGALWFWDRQTSQSSLLLSSSTP